MKRYAIVGNGAAGNAAAETIRQNRPRGPDCHIFQGKDMIFTTSRPFPIIFAARNSSGISPSTTRAGMKGTALSLSGTRK